MMPLIKINSLNALARMITIALCTVGIIACSGPEVAERADLGYDCALVSDDDIDAFAFDPAKACLETDCLIASPDLSPRDALTRLQLIERVLHRSSIGRYRATCYHQAGDLYLRSSVRDAKAKAFAAYIMANDFNDSSAEIALNNLSGSISKSEALLATAYVAMYYRYFEVPRAKSEQAERMRQEVK